ncbi:class I SAM-dependent methyltransferase [Actibacterium sp.]|uniref:class I SAM-dependent methyltransferase n=1 Tax=Actibacterium sp. TaxID=1872125 RepID=UPI003568E5A3
MTVDTTYEPYSEDEGYISANEALMATLDLSDVRRVADLACGTGLMSQQLLKRKPNLAICGIDLDAAQIEIAGRKYAGMGVPVGSLEDWRAAGEAESGAVHLRVQSAMELPFADDEIDLVVIGNAIHMMPNKQDFVKEVARVLRPGGHLVFNSVFYVGTFPPGSEAVFTEWMKEATLVLFEMNDARKAAGQAPIPRQRGKGTKAFSKGWLSAEEWAAMLEDAGFDITRVNHRNVPISREGLALVGAYGGLAEVLMSGYPVDIASTCLQEAAGRAFDNLGITEVPRNWLEMTARRT